MSSHVNCIMGEIGPEQLELFALEFENCYISLCLHFSIYKYQPISSKVGQNIYDSKISYGFDEGCNRNRTSGVICP